MTSNEKKKSFTASERIKQLNDIDKDVIKLLQSAGLAVKALTNATSDSAQQLSTQSSTIDRQRGSFSNATAQYFSLLSSVDVRLRRQIYALKEADILPTEVHSRESRATLAVNPPNAGLVNASNSRQAISNGGLGNLDVGWLNSRNDNVGKEMEAELWEEASKLVERLDQAKATEVQDVEMRSDGSNTAQSQPQ